MELRDYVTAVLLSTDTNTREVTFDVGVTPKNDRVLVDDQSANRVKFRVEIGPKHRQALMEATK